MQSSKEPIYLLPMRKSLIYMLDIVTIHKEYACCVLSSAENMAKPTHARTNCDMVTFCNPDLTAWINFSNDSVVFFGLIIYGTM
jgi:hypothetical protein